MSESDFSEEESLYICNGCENISSIPVETSKKKKKKKKKKSLENNQSLLDNADDVDVEPFTLFNGEVIECPSGYRFEDAEQKIDFLTQKLRLLDNRTEEIRSELNKFKLFHEVQVKKRKELHQGQQHIVPGIKSEPGQLQSLEEAKSPPIYVYNVTAKEIKTICEFAIGNQFILVNLNKYCIEVHCATMEHHETIKRILEYSKKEFSLTKKENKYHRMLLHGRYSSLPEEELLSKLEKLEYPDLRFVSVERFVTRNREKYLVKITSESNLDLLKRINVIGHKEVVWEDYVLQCSNCQEYGHREVRCKNKIRCVKCAMNHSWNECTIKSQRYIDMRFKCALCDARGHTADSKQCPEYSKAYLQQKLKYSSKAEQNKISDCLSSAPVPSSEVSSEYAEMYRVIREIFEEVKTSMKF